MRLKLATIVALVTLCVPATAQVNALDQADSLSALFEYRTAISFYHLAESGDQFRRLNGLSTAENMLGLDYLAQGEKDSAEVHFRHGTEAAEQMSAKFPDSAATYFNLAATWGNLALLKGGPTKVRIGRDVERQAVRAVEIDSTYSDALSLLGVFYRELAKLSWIERFIARSLLGGLPPGSLEKSERYLRSAVKVDPASPFAMYELGQTLLEMKRPDEARLTLEGLMTLRPRNSENARDMAEAAAWLSANKGNKP